MNPLFLSYGTLISPLGIGSEEHFTAFSKGASGVKQQLNSGFTNEHWYLGKIESLSENRYDDLLTLALKELKKTKSVELLASSTTLFIVSTTKANLNALPNDTFASTRRIIKEQTSNPNELVIISNACISGVLAINSAAEYLQYSNYKDVIIIGIDALFDFVVYGFQSLFALSDELCKPFDKDRKGISIGEACGIVHLSTSKPTEFAVNYLGGACSNDANHISGPSRTGEGLVRSISKAIERAAIPVSSIDFISAHGTGTFYNDEMESIAFERTELNHVPLNSMKGYFGHTLGAAGIIEVIMSMVSMEKNCLFTSLGFEEQGTSQKLNIIQENTSSEITTILKTASGFGGGNAALILQKI